jgi:urease alpha subunit
MNNDLTIPSTYVLADPAQQAVLDRIKDSQTGSLEDEAALLRYVAQVAVQDTANHGLVVKTITSLVNMMDRLTIQKVANNELLTPETLLQSGIFVTKMLGDAIMAMPTDRPLTEDDKLDCLARAGENILSFLRTVENASADVKTFAQTKGIAQ